MAADWHQMPLALGIGEEVKNVRSKENESK